MAAALLPLAGVDLTAEWLDDVLAVDAGPEQGAVTYVRVSTAEAAALGSAGLRSGWVTHAADTGDDFERRIGLEPVPVEWFAWRRRWRVCFAVTWTGEEHNNTRELQACALAVRHLARSTRAFGKRWVILTDSLVTLGAVAKGRTSSAPLARCLRHIAATALLVDARLALRYIPTWGNPADGPSRGTPGAIVHPETIEKAREKFAQRGWPMPQSLRAAVDYVRSIRR